MIKVKSITTKKMKWLDRVAIEQYGIPSLILMENAGRGIADLADELLKKGTGRKYYRGKRKKILIVSGKGNNGGDAFVAARHLANRGYLVQIVSLAPPNDLKDDPKLNYSILRKMQVPIEHINSQKLLRFKVLIQKADLILDGIFGVGLTRPVTGIFYDVISILNASEKQILAIDVPSGLDSDSGEELGISIRACATGTLAAAKRGLFLKAGPKCSGKITVLDISIPKILLP